MNERKDGKIDRRDFLRSVSKAALPTIALIGLALPATPAGRTAAGSTGRNPGRAVEPGECVNTCEGTCKGTCEDTCRGHCKDDCQGTCQAACRDDCQNNCKGTCEGFCGETCKGGCQGTCENTCKGSSK